MIIMRKSVCVSSIVALLFLLATAVTAQQRVDYELRRYVDVQKGAYTNDAVGRRPRITCRTPSTTWPST